MTATITIQQGFSKYSFFSKGVGEFVLPRPVGNENSYKTGSYSSGFHMEYQAKGSDFSYDENRVLIDGNVDSFQYYHRLGRSASFHKHSIKVENLNTTVKTTAEPEFWDNLLEASNHFVLEDGSSYKQGIYSRAYSVKTYAGDDVVTDAIDLEFPVRYQNSKKKENDYVIVNLGEGNDTITQANNKQIYVIDGGTGSDTVIYEEDREGVAFNLDEDGSVLVTTQYSGIDRLTNVEFVQFAGSDEVFNIEDLIEDDGNDDGFTVDDDPEVVQYLIGETEADTFVINGASDAYRWAETLDGKGVVVWNHQTGCHDILYGYETIKFTDETIDISEFKHFNSIHDVADETQYLDGTDATDRFVINGNSSEYGWAETVDGQGVVVWNHQTGCHDVLYGFEAIVFTDETIDISAYQLSNSIQDDPGVTQCLNGTDVIDRFVIDGNSSCFQWDKTQDDEGVVVWNEKAGDYDILYDFEEIVFNDQVIEVSDIV